MMSSTRDEHFIQPTASSQMQSFDQSQSKIFVHPQPPYMPVVERESLLMDLPQSSTQSSRYCIFIQTCLQLLEYLFYA